MFYNINTFFGLPLKSSIFIIATMEIIFAMPFILGYPFLAACEQLVEHYLTILGITNEDTLLRIVLINAGTILFVFHVLELCAVAMLFRAVKYSHLLLMLPWMLVNILYILLVLFLMCVIVSVCSSAAIFCFILFVYRLYCYMAMASLYEKIRDNNAAQGHKANTLN